MFYRLLYPESLKSELLKRVRLKINGTDNSITQKKSQYETYSIRSVTSNLLFVKNITTLKGVYGIHNEPFLHEVTSSHFTFLCTDLDLES